MSSDLYEPPDGLRARPKALRKPTALRHAWKWKLLFATLSVTTSALALVVMGMVKVPNPRPALCATMLIGAMVLLAIGWCLFNDWSKTARDETGSTELNP